MLIVSGVLKNRLKAGVLGMFAQLILGIYFVAKGIYRLCSKKPDLLIAEWLTKHASQEVIPVYLKKTGKFYIAVGTLMISMGQLDYWYNPEPLYYIMTYIFFGIVCIAYLLYFNKRYLGAYLPR